MTAHRRSDARDDVLPALVAGAVQAADALLATGPGQVLVRQVATRLTANAVAARGHLPPGWTPPVTRTAAAPCWPPRAGPTSRRGRRR